MIKYHESDKSYECLECNDRGNIHLHFKYCPNCGDVLDWEWLFDHDMECSDGVPCGGVIKGRIMAKVKYIEKTILVTECENCGVEVIGDSFYCQRCGTKIDWEESERLYRKRLSCMYYKGDNGCNITGMILCCEGTPCILYKKKCKQCNGTGQSEHDRCDPPNYYECEGCNGRGYVE